MRQVAKLTIIPLGLFFVLAALIWGPSLRVSPAEMKNRAALYLNRGDSYAQVQTFLRAQHMRMTSKTAARPTANGSTGATRMTVELKPLLAPPLYFVFEFTHDTLDSYRIEDNPTNLGASVIG